jgi:hypothetical protein
LTGEEEGLVADDLAIYETIAAAVAEAREPDLSPFDPSQVRTALERVLRFRGPQQDFLAWLNSRVRLLSGGRVSIEERPIDDRPLEDQVVQAFPPGQDSVPELPVRVVVEGEPFAEPAVVRADDPVVQFPMRG